MTKKLIAHLRRNVVAYLALSIALGGTSYAATRLPANSVDTRAIQNGAVKAEKLGKLPAVSASADGTSQRLSDGVWSAVRLTQESFDVGGMHSSGENDSRLVAPRTGTYVVQGTAVFQAGVCCGTRSAEISLHRASGGTVGVERVYAGGGDQTLAHLGAIVRMRAGDYLELLALETSNQSLGVGGRLSAAFVGS
ncbi:MAG TPA: hypothetical protein VF520_11965 [Thermoleophilaceae bacterium]|jgi:hypothetical protein